MRVPYCRRLAGALRPEENATGSKFDFQSVIDEAVEVIVTANREMAMKNDSIMAGARGYNGRSESLDEAVDGVLLQRQVWRHPLVGRHFREGSCGCGGSRVKIERFSDEGIAS